MRVFLLSAISSFFLIAGCDAVGGADSAYSEYELKTKINQGLAGAGRIKEEVATFQAREARLPKNSDEIKEYKKTLEGGGIVEYEYRSGHIIATFTEIAKIEGETIRLTPVVERNGIYFSCSGSVPLEYRPASCHQ